MISKMDEGLNHLIGIEHLSLNNLLYLLKNSEQMAEILKRDIKKVPTLRGRSVINAFLEPSTRTRVSFELAAKRLSADAVNISSQGSSISKGETLLDTAYNLEAMAPDVIVIRHEASGAASFLAKHLTKSAIINAGDGTHEHPTQALLDLLTLREHFNEIPRGKVVVIVGDILHSRVARSNILAHLILGNEIRLAGPPPLVPKELETSYSSVKVFHELAPALSGCDVIICLRMQKERMSGHFVPDLDEYSRNYGLSSKILKNHAPNAVIMHPGPLNRGVEISSDVADGSRSLITNQVTNGVAVRMAVLHAVIANRSKVEQVFE